MENFILKAKKTYDTLVISFVGYKTKEILLISKNIKEKQSCP
jgi:hypothetical protein